MPDLLRMRKTDILAALQAAVLTVLEPGPVAGALPNLSPTSSASVLVGSAALGSASGPLLASGPDCLTEGCVGVSVVGFPICRDCVDLAASALNLLPSVRPGVTSVGNIDDLERRLSNLHRGLPLRASKSAYSESSEASAGDDPTSGLEASSALLRYRRKLIPATATKQSVFEAIKAELAVARVSLPSVFPASILELKVILSELGKKESTADDVLSLRADYISILAGFLHKHASWRANKSALRKRQREPTPRSFNARVNPKAPRSAIPDRLLDGHHIGECRAFVGEFKAWEASAETDVIPPSSLDFMRNHVVPTSCDFAHPTRGVYNIFSTNYEKSHAIRRARSIYRDSVKDVATSRISRYESLVSRNRDRLTETQARVARRLHGTSLSTEQRRATLARESSTLARLALESRLVMCGSKAWKLFFAGLDAAADADLVARGLGLPDDSDDDAEHARAVAAKAWRAASAVALTPVLSSRKSTAAPAAQSTLSFAQATKNLESTLKKLLRGVTTQSPLKKLKITKNRCFQCNKRGCKPSNPTCANKGKTPHPKSRNGRRKTSKKRAPVNVTTPDSSSQESS
jgi:hypothetical protein